MLGTTNYFISTRLAFYDWQLTTSFDSGWPFTIGAANNFVSFRLAFPFTYDQAIGFWASGKIQPSLIFVRGE